MELAEYRSYDALGLAALVRKGEVTAGELLDAALAAVEERNPRLNALVGVYESMAREAIAAGPPSGPFHGVPFAIKDLWTDVRGMPTSNGSALFATGTPASRDAEVVRRYRQAGFVLVGKTNTPELGMSPSTEPALFGPTRNPWQHDRSAGGSSGGAAAAVASGIIPVAHATDGGGSIRIPAANCGLFGLKPTRGRISAAPNRGESWNGLGMTHVVSRTVRDSAAALDATAGYVAGDPYTAPPASRRYLEDAQTDPGQLRIGLIVNSYFGATVDPEYVATAERSARRCEELGHIVVPMQWPDAFESVAATAGVVMSTQASAAIDAQLRSLGRELRAGDLEPVTAAIAEGGRSVSGVQYVNAISAVHATGRAMASLLADVDILMTPTLGRLPAPLGTLSGDDLERFRAAVGPVTAFVGIANVTGQPAMTLPLDTSADGLPMGTQVLGRFGDEATLFRLAGQLERAVGFRPVPS